VHLYITICCLSSEVVPNGHGNIRYLAEVRHSLNRFFLGLLQRQLIEDLEIHYMDTTQINTATAPHEAGSQLDISHFCFSAAKDLTTTHSFVF
jgi:hypothetical protein